jgi:hypothetical protein
LTGTANRLAVTNGNGSITLNVPDSAQLSVAKLTNLGTNGIVRTGNTDGTLSVDTTVYAEQAALANYYTATEIDNAAYVQTPTLASYVPYSGASGAVDLNNKALKNAATLSVGSATLPTGGVAYFNGNVGIGNTAPGANLHVGTGAASGVASAPALGTSDALIKGILEVDRGVYAESFRGDGSNLTAVVATKITSGAAPAVSGAGDIALDTTADDLIFYGGAKRSINYKQFKSYTVESPADTDNILIFKAPYNLTITNINCVVDPADADGSESAVLIVQERDSAGDNPAGVDGATTITCGNVGAADDGALSNGPIDSGDWVSLDIGTVTGTVSQLAVTIIYEKTAE